MAFPCVVGSITGDLTQRWLLGLVQCGVDLVDNEVGIEAASDVQLRSQLINLGGG